MSGQEIIDVNRRPLKLKEVLVRLRPVGRVEGRVPPSRPSNFVNFYSTRGARSSCNDLFEGETAHPGSPVQWRLDTESRLDSRMRDTELRAPQIQLILVVTNTGLGRFGSVNDLWRPQGSSHVQDLSNGRTRIVCPFK